MKESNIHILLQSNARGNDRSLASDGHQPGYWYSVLDGITFLRDIREQELIYSDRNNADNELSSFSENDNRIFIADPYHRNNFSESFSDDIGKIINGIGASHTGK